MDNTETETLSSDDQFWAEIRRNQFLLNPEVTFLQGGSVGPSPRPVVDKVTESIRAFESDPLHHQSVFHPLVQEAREKLAAFVGAHPDRIAFVQNTTMGMSVPAQGLTFKAGDEVLMTDQEYPAVSACWWYIAERYGMTVRTVELPLVIESPEQIVRAMASGITPNTRVMVVSHVYWTTGLAVPLTELVRLGRDHGLWVLIDGAHAVGMVPLRLDDAHPHCYISSCHKWLLSAKGTGMLYVSDDAQDHIRPLILGRNVYPNPKASRFDMVGTRDMTPFLGLAAAIDFQMSIGWERIRAYCQGLAGYLKERVKRIKGARVLTPADPALSGFITTFTIDGADLPKLQQQLWNEARIETTCFRIRNIPVFRISTHFYNSRQDIDKLVSEIQKRLS